jgi:hypothetical protein
MGCARRSRWERRTSRSSSLRPRGPRRGGPRRSRRGARGPGSFERGGDRRRRGVVHGTDALVLQRVTLDRGDGASAWAAPPAVRDGARGAVLAEPTHLRERRPASDGAHRGCVRVGRAAGVARRRSRRGARRSTGPGWFERGGDRPRRGVVAGAGVRARIPRGAAARSGAALAERVRRAGPATRASPVHSFCTMSIFAAALVFTAALRPSARDVREADAKASRPAEDLSIQLARSVGDESGAVQNWCRPRHLRRSRRGARQSTGPGWFERGGGPLRREAHGLRPWALPSAFSGRGSPKRRRAKRPASLGFSSWRSRPRRERP